MRYIINTVSYTHLDVYKRQAWSVPQTVQVRRDFSYNDNALLGKLDEEARLNTDMRSDAIREIMRRLSAIKLAPK